MTNDDSAAWRPPATRDAPLPQSAVAQVERAMRAAIDRFGRVALACSLQAEDLVLLDVASRLALDLRVVVLDTLRLPVETLAYLDEVTRRFGRPIERVTPKAAAVAAFEARHGRFGFYESREEREACCRLRKVVPLSDALAGCGAWITGQRRAQSATRAALAAEERDPVYGIAKLNPLAEWSETDVWRYLRDHDIPAHPLYARGYASIGCEPCTRAVRAGEPVRAGRWWWEDAASKECGLHAARHAGTAA